MTTIRYGGEDITIAQLKELLEDQERYEREQRILDEIKYEKERIYDKLLRAKGGGTSYSYLKHKYVKIADDFPKTHAAFLIAGVDELDRIDPDTVNRSYRIEKIFLYYERKPLKLEEEFFEVYGKLKRYFSTQYTPDVFEEEFPSKQMMRIMLRKYREIKQSRR